jgi:hypothetical protein
MPENLPHASLEDLRLDEIAEGRWRVCDRRFRATNPRSVLGFIQVTDAPGGSFEVTDVRRAGDPVTYATREEAIAVFLSMTSPVRSPSLSSAGELPY